MKITAIIQARMGSTRLPGKVLMEVGGKTVLAHLIDRLKCVSFIDEIVVATTTQPRDSQIAALCEKLGVGIYRGSEEDVLERYVDAARLFKSDVVVRATSDEPYKDPAVIHQILEAHVKSKFDYTSNVHPRTFPDGSCVEVINAAVLEKAERNGKMPPDREHVTFYIYNRPWEFKIQNIEAQGKLRRPDLRYCLDTAEDMQVIRAIFEHLGRQTPYFTMEQIIDFLDENESIRRINKNVCPKVITY